MVIVPPGAASGRKTSARARALDGLRGIAAVVVGFYHAILFNDHSLLNRVLYVPLQTLHTARDIVTKVFLATLNGEISVLIFFVLSGCVLRQSLERRGDQPGRSLVAAFAAVRAVRIYAPLLVCLVFFYAVSLLHVGSFPRFTPMQLAENATLARIAMHGATWTLRVEMLAVPFIALAWLWRRRFGVVSFVPLLAYGCYVIFEPAWIFRWYTFSQCLLEFLLGMFVAEPFLRPAFARHGRWACLVAGAALFVPRAFLWHAWLGGLVIQCVAAATMVGCLFHGGRLPSSGFSNGRASRRRAGSASAITSTTCLPCG